MNYCMLIFKRVNCAVQSKNRKQRRRVLVQYLGNCSPVLPLSASNIKNAPAEFLVTH